MKWFDELRRVNTNLLQAAREAKAEAWLRRSAVEKYAEPTHFIFELLQNADDQEAKRVQFKLHPDRVEFCHWGNPFRQVDVERITRLGDSGKPFEVHKIGNYGIGFKSVFAVTDRPEVYCTLDGKPFAFAIEDLIVPVAERSKAAQGAETLFVLPYARKAGADPSAAAAEQLEKVGPEVLMFLNHIAELSWTNGAGVGERWRCHRGDDGVVTFERSGGGKSSASAYRVFRSEVTLPDGGPAETCVAFRVNADGKVVSEAGPTKLWVYFETEEQTGLRFRFHGPFKLTDNRAHIMRAEPFNHELIDNLAALAASALMQLCDEDRIVRKSLNAFPIPADDVPEALKKIADGLWQTMRGEEVLPKASGGYANPAALWQGTQELRTVFDDNDLTALASDDAAWAVSAGQRHSRIDRLLTNVGGAEFNLESVARQLEIAAQTRGRVEAWLKTHDDAWMQDFYQLLNGIKDHYQALALGRLPIVRAADGEHLQASQVRFAPGEDRKDSEIEVENVSLVAASVLSGEKQTREEIAQFLRRIGVEDVNEQDYIRALLAKHYRPGGTVPDMKAHLRHIERFAAWRAGQNHTRLFDGATLFLSDDSDALHGASQLYVDKPFHDSGLASVYGAKGPWASKKKPLAKRYRRAKGVLDFACTLGAIRSLVPEHASTYNHPERSALRADYYRSGTRWRNATDSDWIIPGLEQLLGRRDHAVSLCVWRSLQSFDRTYFFANFRHAENKTMREKPASFVYQLRAMAWIPSAAGTFHKPEDITEAELAPEFDTTDRTGWLDAIGFGTRAMRRAVEYQEQRRAVIRAGIPDEFAEWFQELSEAGRRSVLEAGFRELETRKPEFPDGDAPNPARRRTKVAEEAAGAPEKRREVRERTVRVEPPGQRESVRICLTDLYTNDDGVMVCQCCREAMPFQLANGSYYFEAVQFDPSCETELSQNYLALCPVCAAKYQNARTTSDAEVRAALENGSAEIPVVLAGNPESIRFGRKHKNDLLSAFGALPKRQDRSA
jgi:hypothetical protein